MNFDGAIDAHTAWKTKLAMYIRKPDKSLNADVVGSDKNCDLGKWIHGEAQGFQNVPEFNQLKAQHAQFHRCAGEIIRRADRGEKVSEDVSLGSKSPYAQASVNVVALIMGLKSKKAA
jgi:hypothetical protein